MESIFSYFAVDFSAGMIYQWMETISAVYIYIFLLVSVFVENIFPPWPSDLIIVFCGILIDQGKIELTNALLSIMAGNAFGMLLMYFAGARMLQWLKNKDIHSHSRFMHHLLRFTSVEDMEKAGVWFHKFGLIFVFLSRFFPGVRFFVSIIAGASGFPLIRYTTAFLLGSMLWSFLLLKSGSLLSDQWDEITEILNIYSKWFSYAVYAILLVFVIFLYIRSRKKNKQL
jgi:membrane protein DedA with SNARE-associated domain